MAVGVGALMGGINGLLVAYGRIPAIIVTLGTLRPVFRGLLVEYWGARKTVTTANLRMVSRSASSASTCSRWANWGIRGLMVGGRRWWRWVGGTPTGNIKVSIRAAACTRRGRTRKPPASAGPAARRDLALAYILCGALSGLAGFMFLVRFGDITVVAAAGMELQAVAAVVVGGVNVFRIGADVTARCWGLLLIEPARPEPAARAQG